MKYSKKIKVYAVLKFYVLIKNSFSGWKVIFKQRQSL
jgi:hypothetical protein